MKLSLFISPFAVKLLLLSFLVVFSLHQVAGNFMDSHDKQEMVDTDSNDLEDTQDETEDDKMKELCTDGNFFSTIVCKEIIIQYRERNWLTPDFSLIFPPPDHC